MLNQISVSGRLTKDVVIQKTKDNKSYAEFSIACQRDYKEQDGSYKADFIKVKVFGVKAECLALYTRKGSTVNIAGRFQIDRWTSNDGKTHYDHYVLADNCYFHVSRNNASSDNGVSNMPNASSYFPNDNNMPW